MHLKATLVIVPLLVLAGCGQPEPAETSAFGITNAEIYAPLSTENSGIGMDQDGDGSAVGTSSVSAAQTRSVCKAAIAEMFGHSPRIMKATAIGDLVRVTYNRPDDGKRWINDCRLDGDRIMWRGVMDGSPGRWRNNPADDAYTFKVEGKKVVITTTYSDGSVVSNKQPLL